MAKISSLVSKLSTDFPDIHFRESDDDLWSPDTQTVSYTDDPVTLLHETAHGILKHQEYHRDIDLLKLERDAWDEAMLLASSYDVPVDAERVEKSLDSYRDWLHARSTCPGCSQTGIQVESDRYHCLGCDREWQVNEARRCQLRRYSPQKQ
jgi:hypothetical protein